MPTATLHSHKACSPLAMAVPFIRAPLHANGLLQYPLTTLPQCKSYSDNGGKKQFFTQRHSG